MENLEAQPMAVKKAQNQLNQAALDLKLKVLQELNLNDSVVNVYVAKISTSNKEKRFIDIKRLKIHGDHKNSFKKYATECVAGHEHICELKTLNTNQDNRFFHVEKAATDFAQMEELVTNNKIDYVTKQAELNNFNAYVIQLTFGEEEQSIFAFRYISGAWSVNKTSGKFFGLSPVKNELIVSIDSDPRFQITPYIDFIQFKDDIFIADVKQFETAMNFHERLREKKTEAISALCASSALVEKSKDTLTGIIGNDKHLMRQLASVHEKGYFSNDIWLTQLKNVADEAGNWKIKFDHEGKIVVEDNKEYIKELLTLLQNKRVKTVVDGVMFDVDGELIALDVAV